MRRVCFFSRQSSSQWILLKLQASLRYYPVGRLLCELELFISPYDITDLHLKANGFCNWIPFSGKSKDAKTKTERTLTCQRVFISFMFHWFKRMQLCTNNDFFFAKPRERPRQHVGHDILNLNSFFFLDRATRSKLDFQPWYFNIPVSTVWHKLRNLITRRNSYNFYHTCAF